MKKVFVLTALTALFFTCNACEPDPEELYPEAAAIISEKCAGCHSEKLVTLPELAHENYLGGCGG